MEMIKVKLYRFNELKEDIKDKVIQNNYDINVNYDWWEFIKEDLASFGIKLKSFDIDRRSFAEIHLEDFYHSFDLILKWHGENCETYKIAERYIKEYDSIKDKMDNLKCYENDDSDEEYLNKLFHLDRDLEDLDEEYQKEFSEEVLSMLRREYEYLISEDAIIETLEANDYKFLKHGAMWID